MYTNFCHYSILDIIISVDVVAGSVEKKDYQEFNLDVMAADETTKNSSREGLFYFINKCVTSFTKDKKFGKKLPTHIVFTFPFHESLTSGKLIHWMRDIQPTVVEPPNVAALVNDATGILLAMGNKEPDCHIGLSLRDRANACYMEELDAGNCKVINMEFGAFGDKGMLDQWRTNYDGMGRIDDNPSKQL